MLFRTYHIWINQVLLFLYDGNGGCCLYPQSLHGNIIKGRVCVWPYAVLSCAPLRESKKGANLVLVLFPNDTKLHVLKVYSSNEVLILPFGDHWLPLLYIENQCHQWVPIGDIVVHAPPEIQETCKAGAYTASKGCEMRLEAHLKQTGAAGSI